MQTNTATQQTVNFNPPRAGGKCALAWETFAECEARTGAPCTSKQLADIAEATGQNLTNLRIELSRYNRFMATLRK